jgi:hypothetical protein
MEYTRLDQMIDVMFTTAKDVETAAAVETTIGGEEAGETIYLTKIGSTTSKGTWEFTDAALLQEKRELIVDALNDREGVNLIKRSRALYWDAGHTIRVWLLPLLPVTQDLVWGR